MVQISLIKLQRYIQANAHRYFPAREIWMNSNGEFWSYDENGSCLYTTTGYFNGNKIIYQTNVNCGENIENSLTDILRDKIEAGFKCFAVQI